MNFTPVSELPKRTRGNSQSGDVLKSFLEADIPFAKLELDPERKLASVRSTLTTYIKAHNVPVKVVTVGTELFLRKGNDSSVPADVDAEVAPADDELAEA